MSEVYFMGIDPSTKKTGFCILNASNELVEYGAIDMSKIKDHGEALHLQFNVINELVIKYKPKKILVEDQFFSVNKDTLKKLARSSAIYMLLGEMHGVDTELIYPTQWRKITHDNGKAKKEDTFKWVQETYKLEGLVFREHNDLTDAIGICYAAVLLDGKVIVDE